MKNFFKKFFGNESKKDNKMEITETSIEDAKKFYSAMQFEWIKGDNIGIKENYKDFFYDGENTFIVFDGGSRINTSLLEEFMIYYPAPPKKTNVENAQYTEIVPRQSPNSTVTSIVYSEDPVKNEAKESPIYKLLNKQKKNIVEVSIKLKLNLPPKELFGVLSSSFDDAENEIIEFVLDGIDIEDIKKSLSKSIKEGYYNLPTNVSKNENPKKTTKITKNDEQR
jgi:hypothetical protein